MQSSHHRRREETFLPLNDLASSHTDIRVAPIWPQLVTDLNTVNTYLEGHAGSEAGNQGTALQGTDRRSAARATLREDLETIVRTARAIDEDHPGFKAKFRMPEGNSDQGLIGAGLGLARNAAPGDVKALFISHGMPSGFLEDLQDDIAEFQSAITEQSGGRRQEFRRKHRPNRRPRHDDQTKDGRHSPRRLPRQPRVVAEWETASHIEQAPKKKKGGPGRATEGVAALRLGGTKHVAISQYSGREILPAVKDVVGVFRFEELSTSIFIVGLTTWAISS